MRYFYSVLIIVATLVIVMLNFDPAGANDLTYRIYAYTLNISSPNPNVEAISQIRLEGQLAVNGVATDFRYLPPENDFTGSWNIWDRNGRLIAVDFFDKGQFVRTKLILNSKGDLIPVQPNYSVPKEYLEVGKTIR